MSESADLCERDFVAWTEEQAGRHPSYPACLRPRQAATRRRAVNAAVKPFDAAAGVWDLSGMAVRISKNVSPAPELEPFVDGQAASGRHRTAGEVARAGLRLLQFQETRARRGGRPEPADTVPWDAR